MNANTIENKNQIIELKKDAKELAGILVKIQELPMEERIAMQYYIKGTLNGIQMAGEGAKLMRA